MAKSYYAILGISSMATSDEIRSAYRRLAKAYHPDHYSGGSNAFREVHEAYSVLSDAERRRHYEEKIRKPRVRRAAAVQQQGDPEPLIPGQAPRDLGDISPLHSFQSFTPSYDEIFDWMWRNFSSLSPPKSGRIQTLTLEVPVSREQALYGGTARIMVPAYARCPLCLGRGSVGPYVCHRCAGEGAISGEVPIAIAFPAGLVKDHAVAIPLDRYGIRNLRLTVVFRVTDDTL